MDNADHTGNEKNKMISTDNENYLLTDAFSKAISSPWLRLKADGRVIDSGNFDNFPLGKEFFSAALKESGERPDLNHRVFNAIQKAFQSGQIQRVEHVQLKSNQDQFFDLHVLQSGEDEVLVVCSKPDVDIDQSVDISLVGERFETELKRYKARQKSHQLIFEFICEIHSQTQLDEALSLVKRYGKLIFPDSSADFLIVKPRTGSLESLTGWGEKHIPGLKAEKDQCSVFTNRSILMEPTLYCKAVLQGEQDQRGYHLCLPVMSKEEIYGVLRLNWQDEKLYLGGEELKQTVCVFVEQISSFLEKLQLKQTIKNQSMKDPVSGLYNRKYFLEAMLRELHRVQRNEKTLSVLLIQARNLQDIRKTYGAEIYKKVIGRFVKLLYRTVRISDLVCHYQGDVFVISMAGMGREILQQRIKEVFLALRNEKFPFEQDILSLNILVGAAVFPEHGKKIEELLTAAEKSLFLAGSSEHTGYVIAE